MASTKQLRRLPLQILPALTLIAAAFISSDAMARRCARIESGARSLTIDAGKISAKDVQDGAAAAWSAIAAAAEKKYGGEAQVGMVALIIRVEVQVLPGITKQAVIPGTFPLDYSGKNSIQMSILESRGINPPSDPAPCEPEQNACCDECANGFASASQLFESGFFSHDQFAAARLPGGTRRLVKRFQSSFDVEFA